jgi:predicted PurR-regulated permease PerM
VIVVYLAIVLLLVAVLVQASASLATSIGQFLDDAGRFEDQLANVLREVQTRLQGLGFTVDLVGQAPIIVENLQVWAGQAVEPLRSIAVASIGVFGNILLLVILSIYIAVDRDDITAFLYRLVPPGFVTEARLLQTSVAKSFGGFIRGQGIMGLSMALITAAVNLIFGLEYAAVTVVAAGILHAIPFFGPFVSWMPPVLVALLFTPSAIIPVLIIMAIGWFVTMNILQPRLMAGSVGIHPIVVLASVVIGLRIAGIPGAIFGIPIAAVLSAFFFHWYGRSRENGTVADRAAKRLSAREGRDVRRPREPIPGQDADVDEVVAPKGAAGLALASATAGADVGGGGVASGVAEPERVVPPAAIVRPTAPTPSTPEPPVSPAPPPEALGGEGER